MMEALVPVNKAMEMTGLSRTTLWRLEKAGKIQATMWNGKKMFFKKDVEPMGERPRKKSI
ncbi:MAG: helix-turn-helix domain-containing protein [Lachnospiraceae bacterium]|jgi:predicted site-specific integrase-resolvase|nr:helix-turn-helix domain-containing protein [Lachnospiraceae bacterium]